MQFRVIVVTDSQTSTKMQPQTHRQDRLQYTVPLSLARSVNNDSNNIMLTYQQQNEQKTGQCKISLSLF